MRRPIVTIGLCVKNVELTIVDTINSILDQDLSHELTEIIFVDDGSKDKTLSIIKNNIKKLGINAKIFHHKWKGLGASRNVIVNNASAKYIVWVDGDMVLSKNYIRKQVEFMEFNPKVGIAKGKYKLHPGANWIATLEIFARVAKNLVNFNNTSKSMGTGGAIYRVKAIKKVNGFNDKLKGYGEDQDIENRIRKAGWSFSTLNVEFRDYERYEMSWRDLWRRYFKRGYDVRYFPIDKISYFNLYGMIPPFSFIAGFIHSLSIYKLSRHKLAFLLPIQYTFKFSAWCYGYMKALMRQVPKI